MTNQEAIKELMIDCEQNNKYCHCKGHDCNDCYIKVAIKALKKIIQLKYGG